MSNYAVNNPVLAYFLKNQFQKKKSQREKSHKKTVYHDFDINMNRRGKKEGKVVKKGKKETGRQETKE